MPQRSRFSQFVESRVMHRVTESFPVDVVDGEHLVQQLARLTNGKWERGKEVACPHFVSRNHYRY